jgi:hypothetical protein
MQSILDLLVSELELLCQCGSPVAGNSASQRERIASLTVRRIETFHRRGVSESDHEHQVNDLAEGLLNQLESRPELAGRLSVDYKHVATALLLAHKNHVK